MLRNNFKIAWRNLLKNKGYTSINLGGLAVGMAVAIVIGLWSYNELSFNKGHKNYDRIAQVMQHVTVNNVRETQYVTPAVMAETLRNDFGSDFKYVVQASENGEHTLGIEDKVFVERGTFFERDITKMLRLDMVSGVQDGLEKVHAIMLSQSLAKVLFGTNDPVGKILKLDKTTNVEVTGIYRDFPENSTFNQVKFMLPWKLFITQSHATNLNINDPDAWGSNFYRTYVQIGEESILGQVSSKIKDVRRNRGGDYLKPYNPQVFLHPMRKWHLYADFENGINTGGIIDTVRLFIVIGVFILLLACINFMNLSTAKSEKRAKEVGIRKTIGSNQRQLVSQFLSESILVTLLAFTLSISLAAITLPYFNTIANSNVKLLWSNPLFWLIGIGFTLCVGILAGIYPAFYLSSFSPIKVLKGVFKLGGSASIFRKVLVVCQFTISIVLLIGTLVVTQQIYHAENRPLGYEKAGLISMPTTQKTHDNLVAIKSRLIDEGAIVDMAETRFKITDEWNEMGGFKWDGMDSETAANFHIGAVNYDYGKTIGWHITEGRDFSRTFSADTYQFVINKSAVAYMGIQDPIGKTMTIGNDDVTIVGVVEDMLIESPYDKVEPYLFFLATRKLNNFILKLNPEKSVKASLATIEKVFKSYHPSRAFEANFVDEAFAQKFGNEKRIGSLVTLFAILAIFISCLGLLGLASYVAEQRTKEIGVRKVHGASSTQISYHLTTDFLKMVGWAILIALPLGWSAMNRWLEDFSYRIEIQWWMLFSAAVLAVAIAVLTVGYQSIKAAVVNPVKSLRTE